MAEENLEAATQRHRHWRDQLRVTTGLDGLELAERAEQEQWALQQKQSAAALVKQAKSEVDNATEMARFRKQTVAEKTQTRRRDGNPA